MTYYTDVYKWYTTMATCCWRYYQYVVNRYAACMCSASLVLWKHENYTVLDYVMLHMLHMLLCYILLHLLCYIYTLICYRFRWTAQRQLWRRLFAFCRWKGSFKCSRIAPWIRGWHQYTRWPWPYLSLSLGSRRSLGVSECAALCRRWSGSSSS